MNNLHKSILLVLMLAITGFASAQKIYNLDLESSILLAKTQSNTMLILQQSLLKASYDLRAATSQLRTHVDLDFNAPNYTETIMQWEDSTGRNTFYPVRRNQMNGYLTIRQPLPTDGSLYIVSGLENLVDYNNDDRSAQISSSIGLRQPIEAFYGYNVTRNAYKNAKLTYDLRLKTLKRDELDLIYNVSQIFYTLLSYHERLNIAGLTLERQQEAFDIAQNKYNSGLIREVEALQMEVDLGEATNNFDIAKYNYVSQLRNFKESLGINLADSVVIKSDLGYKPVFVDMERAVNLALENRLELKINEIRIEQQRMTIKSLKTQGMINGDILVNYNFKGVDQDRLSIPYETAFNNTWHNLQNRPGSFGVGLTINIPLIDWGENRARVHAAQAVLSQNKYEMAGEKVSIERDIRSKVDNLHSSLKRLQLLEKNVLIAEKSFEITRQRYSNGDIDSQAMALERERLNNAYISRLESLITYKLLLSDIMRKTFYDFEKGVSMLGAQITE